MDVLKRIQTLQKNPIYQWEAGQFGEKRRPAVDKINQSSTVLYISFFLAGGAIELYALFSILYLIERTPIEILPKGWPYFFYIFLLSGHHFLRWIVWVLTFIALLLVPPTLSPMIKEEVLNGSWDLLRLMPFSLDEILAAKTLGSVNRQRFLIEFLWLTALSAGVSVCASLIVVQLVGGWGYLAGFPLILLSGLKPILDLAWVILLTLTVSISTRSVPQALIISYLFVLGTRFLTNPAVGVWSIGPIISRMFDLGTTNLLVPWTYQAVPALFLSGCLVITWILFRRQIRQVEW